MKRFILHPYHYAPKTKENRIKINKGICIYIKKDIKCHERKFFIVQSRDFQISLVMNILGKTTRVSLVSIKWYIFIINKKFKRIKQHKLSGIQRLNLKITQDQSCNLFD